jgi:DNA-binding XRE family transcriptional regulator
MRQASSMASLSDIFGQTVRSLRAAAGYSQESFADAIGVHRTYMGTLERGDANPTLDMIARIARGLRLTLTTLFQAVEAGHTGGTGAGTSDVTPPPSTKAQRGSGTKVRRVAERPRRRPKKGNGS